MTRVVLVGVGTMGLRMGRRLLAAGHEVVACDIDPARLAMLEAPVASTPAEALAEADVAITSLPSVGAVERVVLGQDGLLAGARRGATLIEMSTSSPALARRLAAECGQAGVDVLDAPVSGGPRGAEAGTLTIMVGGPKAVLDGQQELLKCLGNVVYAGGHGAGQALKLCNNLLAGCAMAALAEVCALATAEGIDAAVLYGALTLSTGDSRVLRTRFPIPDVDPLHPASAGYEPMFELDLLVKDLTLARALARDRSVETPVGDAALDSYRAAQRAGYGKLDYSAVYLTGRTARAEQRAETESGRRVPERHLRELGERVLARCSVGADAAATVLDCLIEADRRGVHTHGLIRLPAYSAQARAGEIDVEATPVVVHEDGPTALVDGRFAFGAVTGVFAVDDAIGRALEHGAGATAVRNGMHFGSAAHYSLRAARRGLVALVFSNTPASMAPWGASESRLGNNPVSVAASAGTERPPLVLDMALSAASRGTIKLAELRGSAIPPTWALDPDGRPTSDPRAALAGSLLPTGGHKGSGLAVAVDVLAAALSGAEISPRLANTGLTGSAVVGSPRPERGIGHLFLVLDPDRFAGRETLVSRLGDLFDELKESRLAPGFDEVLVPGEPEHRHESALPPGLVDLPAATVDALEELAAAEGLPSPTSGSSVRSRPRSRRTSPT